MQDAYVMLTLYLGTGGAIGRERGHEQAAGQHVNTCMHNPSSRGGRGGSLMHTDPSRGTLPKPKEPKH